MSDTPRTDEVLAIANNFGFIPPDDGVTAEEAHHSMVNALTNLARELERQLSQKTQDWRDQTECAVRRGEQITQLEERAEKAEQELAAERLEHTKTKCGLDGARDRIAELAQQILYLMREGIDEHWQPAYCPIEGDPAEWTDKDVLEAVAGSLAMFGKGYDAAMEDKC